METLDLSSSFYLLLTCLKYLLFIHFTCLYQFRGGNLLLRGYLNQAIATTEPEELSPQAKHEKNDYIFYFICLIYMIILRKIIED